MGVKFRTREERDRFLRELQRPAERVPAKPRDRSGSERSVRAGKKREQSR